MRLILIIVALLMLAGCEPPEPKWGPDQCLRREIFKECMASLPAGPVATHYNGWDEVVSECESTAYHQSIRRTEIIKPECRS